MNILLTGANGFIGRELLNALLEQQHHSVHAFHIVACVRNPELIEQNQKNLQVVTIDFSHAQTPEVWLPFLQDIDVVINTVGIIEESEDIFSGLFWTGEDAAELGLVDGFLTVSQVAKEKIGAEELIDFTAEKTLIEKLSGKVGAQINQSLMESKLLHGLMY